MSRTKAMVEDIELTESSELDTQIQEEAVGDPVQQEASDVEPAEVGVQEESQVAPPEKPRIGVNRFLHLHRQDKMTADLMRSLFRMDLHTESDWFLVRDEMLGHKVTK